MNADGRGCICKNPRPSAFIRGLLLILPIHPNRWLCGLVTVIEELDWPSGMCDVPQLVEILKPNESNPKFISDTKLRSKAEILDAQDLIMRTHWAIRDTHLHQGGMIPENLDWSQDGDMVPIAMSAAVGVVEQTHHTLNWLVNFLDPGDPEDWDQVDTPT